MDSSIVLGNVYGAQLGASCPTPAYSQIAGASPFVDALGYDFSVVPGSAAEDGGDPAFPLDSDGSRNDQGPYLDRLPRELDGGEVLAGG